MTHTSRLLLVASICAVLALYGGYAFAVPHSDEYKAGKYGNNDWDDENPWGDKNKKHGWDDYELKKDWFTWGYGKEDDKWYGGKDWGKDPDCDPPMTHTPEPGTLVLLGSSLAAAGVTWGRRRPRPYLEPSE